MDKFRFLEVINNPQAMTSADFESLEEVLEHYPFCQSAYLLKAKYLFDRGNMHAEKTLRKAAVYATDRVILKQLVLGGHEPPVAEAISPVTPVPVDNIPVEQRTAEIIKDEIKPITDSSNDSVVVVDSVLEVPEEKNPDSAEDSAEKKTSYLNEIPELASEYATSHSFILDEIAAIPDDEPLVVEGRVVVEEWKKELVENNFTDAVEQSLDAAQTTIIRDTTNRRNASGLGSLLEFIDFVDGPEEYGFSHLYKFEELSLQPVYLQNSRLGEEVSELDGNTNTSEAEFLLEYLQYLNKKPVKKPKTNLDRDYIDRFIKEEPRISRIEPRLFDYNKGKDMASESVVEDTELVSENLAQIMVNQNKIKRAIDIYQKLILKYPDKKGYFTQKIEDLDKH